MKIPNVFFAGMLIAMVAFACIAIYPKRVRVGEVWVYRPLKAAGAISRCETNTVLFVNDAGVCYSNSMGVWKTSRAAFVAGSKKVTK